MKQERHWQIKQLFLEKQSVTISELCNIFGISVETARRDLNALEQEGIVCRTHGGATLADRSEEQSQMPPWSLRITRNLEEKRVIAREVLRQISDNSIVALDSGTSTLEVAKLLGVKRGLTILTNDLRIAAEISGNTEHTLYFIGGAMKQDDMITTGFLALEFLDYFSHIDLLVLTGDGFDVKTGMADHNMEMGTLKAAMLRKARRAIAAVDSSKFAVNALYRVCRATDLDMIITDGNAPLEAVQALRRAGVETVMVSP
ncbi:MAG: DeoR/GlpR transcriptional regulator [Oscillibacter sp.]|nr:DeoR/GlpR transcriptional regulator [Oscillibacter sp.]